MAAPDLSAGWNGVGSQIDAIKVYNATNQGEKSILNNAGNSASQSVAKISKGLTNIADKQKRFERDAPTSMDELLNLLLSAPENIV